MIKKPDILDLCPTQFVLGIKEIESKVKKMTQFSDKELKEYCDDHVIPVVIGPKPYKRIYMIDHHHFARACWETKTEFFSIKLLEDYSSLKLQNFWNLMIKKNWTYLHDQFGKGPHSPYALPTDIRCLADDPYRSLAWAVLDAGGFKKMNVPFFEFQWAAFYRQNLQVALHSKSDFKNFIKEAKKLSQSKDAKHLPGYIAK